MKKVLIHWLKQNAPSAVTVAPCFCKVHFYFSYFSVLFWFLFELSPGNSKHSSFPKSYSREILEQSRTVVYARSSKIQGKLSQRHKFIVFWMTTLKDAFSPNEAARLKSQSVSTRPCTPSLIWSIQLYMEECYHLLGRGFPMESLFLKDFDCFYIFYELCYVCCW